MSQTRCLVNIDIHNTDSDVAEAAKLVRLNTFNYLMYKYALWRR